MIALALRAEIERYAVHMRTSNPLFARAERGTLCADHVLRYLANIHCLVSHTPVHLGRAIAQSEARGQTELGRHFRQKRGEEVGHELWAERDVERVSELTSAAHGRGVGPALRRLLSFIESAIDEDPALYLAYILFSEYLIVLLGPEWLDHLETRCGIPRSSMSVVGNHAELDRDHADEAFDSIDALVGDPRRLMRMRAVLLESMFLFDQFCVEIVQEGDEARHAASAQAPAA